MPSISNSFKALFATALIGASRPAQVVDCAGAIANLDFTAEELAEIDLHAQDEAINLWARSSETD